MKNEIENRLRTFCYTLFGIIFSFLFIASSTYIAFLRDVNEKQRNKIERFIVEGIKSRSELIHADFLRRDFKKLEVDASGFLQGLSIKKFKLVLFDSGKCVIGNVRLCYLVNQLIKFEKEGKSRIFFHEYLGDFFILLPIVDTAASLNYYVLVIPNDEILFEQTVLKIILFYLTPFLSLLFLSLYIYHLTEEKIIKPAIREIVDNEKNKIQIQRNMIKQFAHDIRSPIVTLETVVDIYSNEIPGEAKDLVSKALERITSVSDDLLSTEKKKKHYVGNVKEFLIGIHVDKKMEYKDRNLNFIIDCDEKVENLFLNKIELYRVLSNLINNSIEASDKKEVMISITVKFKNDWILISVSDNAGGISVDKIPLIIEGDFTTKENGNGLGVSGARKWLRNIGGEIKMSSQFGIGTTVDLYVPIEFSV